MKKFLLPFRKAWLAVTLMLPVGAAQAQYCTSVGGMCGTSDIVNVSISGTSFGSTVPCITIPGQSGAYGYYPPIASNPPGFTTTLPTGVLYTINVSGSGSAGVWLDYNRNNNFDTNEFAAINPSTRAGTLFVPATASQGPTYIRFRSGVNSASDACTFLGFGQTKDFTVTIGAPVPCPAPYNLTVSNLTNTTASVSFTPGSASSSTYTVTYRIGTTGAVQTVTPAPTGSPVTLTNLTPGTQYTVSVAGNCGGAGSSAVASTTFTTTGTPPCNPPTGLIVSNITSNGAIVSFTAATSAVSTYQLTYTAAGGPNQTATGITSPITLTNLQASTVYTLSLVSQCPSGQTSVAATTTFTTPAPPCEAPTNMSVVLVNSTTISVSYTPSSSAASYTVSATPTAGGTTQTASPNPTGSVVTLGNLLPNTAYTLTVVSNCTGTATPTSPGATTTFTTPLPPCAQGPYVLVSSSNPYTMNFEGIWGNTCDTRDTPGTNWRNTPASGDDSWRREDDGGSANWSNATTGGYTPTGSTLGGATGSHSARFHSTFAPAGNSGKLDLFLNMSGFTTATLRFDYINPNANGADELSVLLSTDGGQTFGATPLLISRNFNTWTARSVALPATVSATTVLRFQATSDLGTTDMGLDNVRISFATPVCTPPTFTAVNLNSTSTRLNINAGTGNTSFSITYTPMGGAPQTASTSTNNITLTSLQPNTSYTVSVVGNCAGGGASTPVTSTFRTLLATHNAVLAAQVLLIPNPAHGSATLVVPAMRDKFITLTLVNNLGQRLRQHNFLLNANGLTTQLSFDGLATGIYLVQLQTAHDFVVKRLVIE
jgi:Fibronectin type III domain/GEVED domain